jgi:hypothetical protein
MTAAEVDVLISRSVTAAVATTGADGYPIATLAWMVRDGGRRTLALDASGEVAASIQAGGPICAVVDDWPDYDGIQGAIIRGCIRRDERGLFLDEVRTTSFDFARSAS